jgi:hypothetical protein
MYSEDHSLEIDANKMLNYRGIEPPIEGGEKQKYERAGDVLGDLLGTWAMKFWFDKSEDIIYAVVDSSCFLSRSDLQEINKLLLVIKDEWGGANMKVVIPTPIYDGISDVVQNNGIPSELIEIFQEILNFDSTEMTETYLRGLNDQEYKSQWREFVSSFSPLKGSSVVNDNKFVRQEFEKLNREFKENLKPSVAQEKAEELSIVTESRVSMLINFGKKAAELIKKTGKKIVEVHSQFKDKLKERSTMKAALRIIISVAFVAMLNGLEAEGWISTDDNIRNTIGSNTPLLLLLNGA